MTKRLALAVSYMLPPMLYPQAIQIGRLLAHSRDDVVAVSGSVVEQASGLDLFPHFDQRLVARLTYPDRARRLPGLVHKLALRLLPFYGRSPDEYRDWSARTARRLVADLAQRKLRPDVLITFGEPMSDHLLGLYASKQLGCPWVAHFSDPWADNPFRSYTPLSNLRNRWDERRVIEQADGVVFTSPETLDLVMQKYPAAWRKKSHVLPHAFEPTNYPPATPGEGELVLRYLGNFYGHRSPEPLFRALLLLQQEDPNLLAGVKVEIVGSMPKRMLWGSVLSSLPAGLVTFVPTVPYSKSLSLMSEADLLLVIDGPDDLSVFLPSKLIDYVGAGKPIFGIVPPGASARVLDALGGHHADPRNPQQIAQKLRLAIAQAAEYRSTSAAWGEPAARAQYHVDRIAGEFARILDAVAGTV